MNKVYVLIEGWRKDGYWHERISGIFAEEEEANIIARRLETLHNLIGIGDTSYAIVSERTIANRETRACPKKIQYRTTLKKDGTFGDVEFIPFYGDGQGIQFSPVFSRHTNGYFSGTIDLIPEDSREQHVARAMEIIKNSLDIIPQWVLDSKDGHDSRHPQGF